VPELPAVGREAVVERLVARIAELPPPRRIAVDGVDAAGKTTLANRLAAGIGGGTRISADDFLRPAEERYRQGRESAQGFYDDSFDHERLRASVLAAPGDPVIVDGIFFFRPDLDDLWTFRIFVHIELEESIRRGARRDADKLGSVEEAERLYRVRYAPGQRLYLDSLRPAERADAIVYNHDPGNPRLLFRGEEPPPA
jgi:uridine kinase